MNGDQRKQALLKLVAAGARAASALSVGGIPPMAVSVRAWNRARPLIAEIAWAPQAHELCRQLSRLDGKTASWRERLHEAFGESEE